MSKSNYEIRAIATDLQTDKRSIKGYAIVFNSPSQLIGGSFREQIAPEAVDRTLNGNVDVRALAEHDPGKVIGRRSAGTLTLHKDSRGVFASIDVPDTTAGNDLLVSVKRGDISGMSFGFRTLKDSWDLKAQTPLRTVQDMEFHELSVVAFPAYPDTSAAVRSLEAAKQHAEIPLDIYERLLKLRRF